MSDALVRLQVSVAAHDVADLQNAARSEFESKWRLFSIPTALLCPSKRIESLMDLVRETTRNQSAASNGLLSLAGQTVDKVTRMVGAYSNRPFRFQDREDEARIIRL
jgi:hypothetical protein